MTPPTGAAARRPRPAVLVALAVLAALTLWLYRPWDPRPFDTVDFSEFLPLLTGDGGPLTHLGRVVGYYVHEHGRFNLLSYVALVAKWELLGTHTAWWHSLRAVEMLTIVAGVYILLRRLNAGVVGAGAGAALFICSRISGEGWIRLTMGEPLGTLLMLGALILATEWRRDPSVRRGLAIGALVVGSVLAKEMLAGLAPMVWLVGAMRDPDGRLGAPPVRRNALELLGWVGIPAIVTFGAAALIALGARGEGFTTLYGSSTPGLATFIESWQRPWQIQGFQTAPASWLLPANTLLGLLTLAGLVVVAVRGSSEDRRHAIWATVCALTLSATYAVLYLPWPFSSQYYAMPFLIGPALLLAVSLTAIERHAARGRWVAWMASTLMLVAATSSTARAAHLSIALEQVNGELATALAGYADADSIVVARRQVWPYEWLGAGPRLRRYVVATGLAPAMPAAVDRLCNEVGPMFGRVGARVVIVSHLHICGALPLATARFRRTEPYLTVTWKAVGMATDTVGVDLLALYRHPSP